MKKFHLVVAVVFAGSAFMTQAAQYVAADNNPASKLCVSAAMDKPIRFLVQVRDSGTSFGYLANQVSCNGINITSFAQQAGNTDNYNRLRHYRRGHVEINDLAQFSSMPADQVLTVSGSFAAKVSSDLVTP